jgi:hypothetical protein
MTQFGIKVGDKRFARTDPICIAARIVQICKEFLALMKRALELIKAQMV